MKRDVGSRPTATGTARLVEGALLLLLLVLAAVLAAPSLVEALRERELDLAAVFYPVLTVAAAALAWTRRTGQ